MKNKNGGIAKKYVQSNNEFEKILKSNYELGKEYYRDVKKKNIEMKENNKT